MKSQSNSQLFPEIPEEIRAVRIGTCFNSITRKLLSGKIAIDPNRLENKSLLPVDGVGRLMLKANSSSSEASEGTFFSLNANIKASYLSASASIGFKASIASSTSTKNQSLNCYCSYVYSGQGLKLQDIGQEKLYNSMEDDFQTAYNKIIESKNLTDYLANYSKFIGQFGHGCVTELCLTSGSAFMITAKYADEAKANEQNYGGNIGINTPIAGGEIAAEYAKKIADAKGQAEMYIIAEQLPSDTPTKEWCNSLMQNIAKLGFDKLAKEPTAINAYTGAPPRKPEKEKGKPSEKEIPKKSVAPDISEKLKKGIMEEDAFKGSWDEYIAAQQKAYDNLHPSQVVGEVQAILSQDNKVLVNSINAEHEVCSNAELENREVAESVWDLGGYIPYAYKVTPWSTLFPDLFKFELPTTFTSIFIAKLYIYYFTKLQFSSYLYFLVDVGGKICENDGIKFDAIAFSNACDDLLHKIQDKISVQAKITEDDYNTIVKEFENYVHNLDRFNSKTVYAIFFNMYDLFVEWAYGFISVDGKDKTYWAVDPRTRRQASNPLPKPFGLLSMMEDAVREYPVIKCEGEILLVHFSPGAQEWSYVNDIAQSLDEKYEEPAGFFHYILKGSDPEYHYWWSYPVGFKDIPKGASSQFTIRGLPMFIDLPFDEIKQFAKPSA